MGNALGHKFNCEVIRMGPFFSRTLERFVLIRRVFQNVLFCFFIFVFACVDVFLLLFHRHVRAGDRYQVLVVSGHLVVCFLSS